MFDSQLKFDVNTELLVKRGRQKNHLMRKLNSFCVCDTILTYQSFIESLLTFSFICWLNELSVKDRNSLNGIVKVCSKISGAQQRDLCSLWEKQVAQKAKRIISQSDHVLSSEFTVMPSVTHYNVRPRRANCYTKVPSVLLLAGY